MPDEISEPQIPQPAPLEREGETPPDVPSPQPPPAAELVVHGDVKSEREIELEQQLADTTGKLTKAERELLERERQIMEREREIQALREIPKPPKAPKVKPSKLTFFDADEE